MTPAGIAVMLFSLTAVLSLAIYCTVRVLSLPAVDMEDIEGPLTIDTRDTQDAD